MFSFRKTRKAHGSSANSSNTENSVAKGTSTAEGSELETERGLFARLANFKIGQRIYGGFALVLAALVFLAAETVLEVENLDKQFGQYGEMAHDALLVANLENALTEMQLNAREYMAHASDQELEEYKKVEDKADKLIAAAKNEIHKPERAELVAKIDEEMKEYKAGFAKITELVRRRHEIVEKSLNPTGLAIRKKLTAIREGAFQAGDHESASYAGIAQEDLLLARLYVLKFLDTNDDASVERTNQEFDQLVHALEELQKSLQDPGRRQLLEEVNHELPQYRTGFDELVSVIRERNKIRKELLDHDAVLMMENAEKIKHSAEKDERALYQQVHADVRGAEIMDITVATIALIVGGVIAFFIGRSVTGPILGLRAAMERLAQGDNEADVPGTSRGDEVGQMAKTVLVFKENAIERARLMSESAKEQEFRAKRAAKMDELIKNFDSAIRAVMANVAAAAETVGLTAQEMAATAEQTNQKAATVAAAAEEASTSATTVAGSTEELTSTISEISEQVTKSSEIARSAAIQAETTNSRVTELAEAANMIGTVVKLISEIAEQTNLLALNATIEAARAGEAGKGFAVVASEVKELASQTAKATTDISGHIEAIQSVTAAAVEEIREISETITSINTMSASVASAMTEQQAATEEIARAVQQAAQGTDEVSSNIIGVSETAATSSAAAGKLTQAAEQLSEQSVCLRREVENFLGEVSAA